MSMISDIRHSRIPVATIVQGKAMSCGAILFSFGAEGMRYMDPDSTLMIHDVSSMAWGKVEEVKVSAEETDRLNQKMPVGNQIRRETSERLWNLGSENSSFYFRSGS